MYRFEEHAQEIERGLFLGDSDSSAVELDKLYSLNVKNILIAGMGLLRYHPETKINYHQIKVIDFPIVNILEFVPECIKFIQEAHSRNEAVLVHCAMGKSRSCSIVCAFLMHKHQISFAEAYGRVKAIRPLVSPNGGFEEQLRLFEKMGWDLDGDSPAHNEYVKNWKPRNAGKNSVNDSIRKLGSLKESANPTNGQTA